MQSLPNNHGLHYEPAIQTAVMAKARRDDRNFGPHCHLDIYRCQRLCSYRPTAHINAGNYISDRRRDLDCAAATITHLDGNRIVQGTIPNQLTSKEWRE